MRLQHQSILALSLLASNAALFALGCGSSDGKDSDVGTGGEPATGSGSSGGMMTGSGSEQGNSGGSLGTGGEGAGAGGEGAASGGSAMGTGGSGSGGMTMGSGGGESGPSLVGWASTSGCGPSGTTGGGDGPPDVTVTNTQELVSALNTNGPLVIAVSGNIDAPESISGVQDKTLIGENGANISGGITFDGGNNVIVKNILFSDGSGGSDDTVELSGSTCFWFDHCEFRDGLDGNLDIVRAADLVTVSWSRFYYTVGHDHMFSNLSGNGDNRSDDEGRINITFHHNWWGAGVRERMPRVRYGKVHVFNNYYKYEPVPGDGGQNYCIAAGQHANLLVENNYFDGSDDPIIYQTNGEGTALITEQGNEYVGTTGQVVSTGGAFTPPYEYVLDTGVDVKDLVLAGAGVK